MSVQKQVLDLLAENPTKVYTLPELSELLNKDKSNLSKTIRKLALDDKLNLEKGIGRAKSKISFKTTTLPHKTTTLPHKTTIQEEKITTLPHKTTTEEKVLTPLQQKINDTLEKERKKHSDEMWEAKKALKKSQDDLFDLKEKSKTTKTLIADFNTFMEKLEKSNSASSKHLKEKINVRGKHRSINKERIIRVIRDIIDTMKE